MHAYMYILYTVYIDVYIQVMHRSIYLNTQIALSAKHEETDGKKTRGLFLAEFNNPGVWLYSEHWSEVT